MRFRLSVHFDKGYIAHPYWPEREKLINIQKESGMNRVRSTAAREQALKAYLQSRGMTVEDYKGLEAAADRQFYLGGDGDKRIIIPAHHVYGCFAQACDQAASAARLTRREQLRSLLWTSDWLTDKTGPDGVWERMVVVTSGTGARLSNQRALRANEYIRDFNAEGEIRLLVAAPDDALGRRLRDFVAFAGRDIGIGASRKMAWGRFEIVTIEPIEPSRD